MKQKLLTVMGIVCLFLMGFSLFQIGKELYTNKQQDTAFDALQQEVAAPAETEENTTANGYGLDLSVVCAQNKDFAAWLRADAIDLSYPVMHTPVSPNYYLRRDFNGDYSNYGTPYMAEDCDLNTSDNLIVYGHNMKNGSMFGKLADFQKQAVWQKNSILQLDTADEHREYQVFAVFLTTVDNPEGDPFPYYSFVGSGSEADYNEYVANCKALALYDTGITPVYGQQLLTLSTCEYTDRSGNGRLVVVGCRVENAE